MAQFSVNAKRFDPYKNFKFRVKWDGHYIAGISKVSALRRTTEVVEHREGGDPSAWRKSPGLTKFEPITLERGVTHGCRIECSSTVEDDSWIWLGIAGLETQYCRVVWHCQEFVGLQFEKPLSEAVFEKLLADQGQLPEGAINDLRSIATRTHWLARQASDSDIAILAELSRKCAVDAVVEGLRRGEGSKDRSAKR